MRNRLVAFWLLAVAVLLIGMIQIGGYTRLTNSGLSIVEWKPITGILYPMAESAWQNEFSKYKQSPEFKVVNNQITLEYFKQIYFVEYFHRLFGRMLGIVFFVPLVFFTFKKYLHNKDGFKFIGIFILGGIQGFIGWYMVKSGLVKNPHVSHFRLAFHLLMAILIYGLIFWQFLNYYRTKFSRNFSLQNFPGLLLLISVIQIFYGALVAGLNAGMIYNQFPMMGDSIVPHEILGQRILETLFYDPVGVQFTHRVVGVIFLILVAIYSFININKRKRVKQHICLLGIVCLQVALGVMSLLSFVQLEYALLHQLVAVFIISNLLLLIHSLVYGKFKTKDL